jgi:hypothetical protein
MKMKSLNCDTENRITGIHNIYLKYFSIYHPKESGPSKREMHKAAVVMQKNVRGFLVRRRFEKLRRKVYMFLY